MFWYRKDEETNYNVYQIVNTSYVSNEVQKIISNPKVIFCILIKNENVFVNTIWILEVWVAVNMCDFGNFIINPIMSELSDGIYTFRLDLIFLDG